MKQDINLFSSHMAEIVAKQKKRLRIFLLYLNMGILLGMIYFVPHTIIKNYEKESALLSRELIQYKNVEQTMKQLIDVKNTLEKNTESIGVFIDEGDKYFTRIKEISTAHPREVMVQSITYLSKEGITIQGVSKGVPALSRYIMQIQDYNIFHDLELSNCTYVGSENFSFEIKCLFEVRKNADEKIIYNQ